MCPFLDWVFVTVELSTSYVFWVLSSYQIHDFHIFLPFCELSFQPLILSFDAPKFYSLTKSSFSFFLLPASLVTLSERS